jgi:hypothetical protein
MLKEESSKAGPPGAKWNAVKRKHAAKKASSDPEKYAEGVPAPRESKAVPTPKQIQAGEDAAPNDNAAPTEAPGTTQAPIPDTATSPVKADEPETSDEAAEKNGLSPETPDNSDAPEAPETEAPETRAS